ncbi:MAG: DUF1571 domain-containing protein [Thermoguttaceae bacterium]
MTQNLVRILLASVFACGLLATNLLAPTQQPAAAAGGVERATWTSPAVMSEHPWMPVLRWAQQEQAIIDRNVRDYSATIVSRERIGDKLEEYQSIFVKVRHRPPSVYVYVLAPESHKGDEAIYFEGRNDGKLLGHTTGITGQIVGTVALDPQGSTAMNGHRHPITELGIRHLCQRLIGLGNNDAQFAESQVRFLSGLKLNDRRCTGVEVIHPVPRTNFQFHRLRLFVDEQLKLPVRYEEYDWPRQPGGPPELVEECNFMNLQLNNGFTDADFDPRNPRYGFP